MPTYFSINAQYTATRQIGEDLLMNWYLGEDASGHSVEIAVIKSEWMTDGLAERLIPVVQRYQGLADPGIVPLLDFHYENKQFYLIYDASESMMPLVQFLADRPELTLSDRMALAKQIMAVVLTLEKTGVIHGYLTPASIRVGLDGSVRILNVSVVATVMRYNWASFTFVDDGLYLTPEFIDRGKWGPTTDVYAMGMLLYYLFLGKLPYPDLSSIERIKKALNDDPISFLDLEPKSSEKLDAFVSKAIEKDPENRFQSMMDMMEAYSGIKLAGADYDARFSRMDSELAASITASQNRNRRLIMRRSIIGGVAIAIIAGLYMAIHLYVNAIPEVDVPDVVGQSITQANQMLAAKGLKSQIEDRQYSDKYPEGTVLSVSPQVGMRIKRFRTIGLIVSQGMESITVPELTGRTVAEAGPLLEKAGYKLEIAGYDYSTQPKGEILVQDPEPYSQLPVNENIRVRVSNGYPIHFSYEYNSGTDENVIGTLFQKHPKPYFEISVTLEVLPNWDQQLVSIFYVVGTTRAQLYSRTFMPGELQIESFRVDQPGVIEIYFGESLAYREMLHRTSPEQSTHAASTGNAKR